MAQTWQLPLIPGYSFSNPLKQRHAVSQTMEISRGCPLVKPLPGCTDALGAVEIAAQLRDAASAAAELQFGQVARPKPKDLFVPSYVAFDRKALRFKAWSQEGDPPFPRFFDIYYYLDDDAMSIYEPVRENSGLFQGKILRRQKLPRDSEGNMWNWRHLNVGMDFTAYGHTYRIYDCDPYTRDFLTSEGIDVNPGQSPPMDPQAASTPSEPRVVKPMDRRGQFQLFDRQVLRFWGAWDDRGTQYGELRPVTLLYYLADDTLEVLDIRQPNDGRDPFPKILHRQRVPHAERQLPDTFPRCYLEVTERDCPRWVSPPDLGIGKTVVLNGRKILLHDCDAFTRDYYRRHFGIEDFIPLKVTDDPPAIPKVTVPPYNGWGSVEDSLQNCFKLNPTKPRQNLTKAFFGDEKVLRYEAVLDSIWPEDQSRRFHLCYYLYDDTLKIVERALPNCGRDTGVFLARQRVPYPRRTRPPDQLVSGNPSLAPVYYSQFDLYVGQTVEVFGRRFVILDADEYVLKYMEHHEDKYPDDAIEAHRRLVQEHKAKLAPPLMSGQHQYQRLGRDDLVELLRNTWSKQRSASRCRERAAAFLEAHADKPPHVTRKDLRRWLRDMPLDTDLAEALIELCGEPRGLADFAALRAILHDASLSHLPLSQSDTVQAWARAIRDRHGIYEARHRIQLFLERYKDQPDVVCTEELRRWISDCQLIVEDDILEAVLVLVGVGQFRSNMDAFRGLLSQVYDIIKGSG